MNGRRMPAYTISSPTSLRLRRAKNDVHVKPGTTVGTTL